jgi:hypothetical protein
MQIPDHVTNTVTRSPLPIRAAEVVPRREYGLPVFGLRYCACPLQFGVN